MANRYWVGGSGTWDTTSTTNWSATSGGASGASVPTAADSVFFDQVATYTVTCTGALTCLDITVSAGTVTFANGTPTPTFAISGSMSLTAGTVWSATGAITFNATTTGKTITTNGVTVSTTTLTFNGSGGGWTLGSALTLLTTTSIVLSTGSFDTSSTGNYSLTGGSFSSSTSTVRTLNLNASTLTFVTVTGFSLSGATNLTVNAGTSQINLTNTSPNFNGGTKTFYNVSFTSGALSSPSITGSTTFNNLYIGGRSTSTGVGKFTIDSTQTVTGTLTLGAGAGPAYRMMLLTSVPQTVRTMSVAALAAGSADWDFGAITITGAAAPISGTRFGNCGGNSGITFPADKTVYYRSTTTISNFSTALWSATSGGASDPTYFPLAQDTLIFPATTYPVTGATVTVNGYNVGSIDMSLRTTDTMSIDVSFSYFHGSFTVGSGVSAISNVGTCYFRPLSTQTLTSAGKAIQGTVFLQSYVTGAGGTLTLLDNASFTTFNFAKGILDLGSFTLSCFTSFIESTSATKTLNFNTGNITLQQSGNVLTQVSTGITRTGSKTVNVTYTGATAVTLNLAGSTEALALDYNFTGGTYPLSFLYTASTSARNINFTGFAGTWGAVSTSSIYGNLTLSTGMTLTASASILSFSGTSGTQQITTNGKTLDFPLTFNGVGGTFQLQDALTMGSTRTATLTNGTLDLNGKTMTVGTAFTTATGTKNLTFNGGTLVCPTASTSAFNNAVPLNFTTTAGTGTGTISMTAATAKTFVGGGSTFNCTLNQGGAGDLTVTGSNTFDNITNTVQPASVLFTAGTTNTFTSGFSLSGTAGNLITIGSVTAAAHTLSKTSGTVSVSYCSISQSTATGGALWQAYTSNGNVNGGSNTGWLFAAGTIYNVNIAEAGSGIDSVSSLQLFLSNITETASGVDSNAAQVVYGGAITEASSGVDSTVGRITFPSSITEAASGVDAAVGYITFPSSVTEAASGVDSESAGAVFRGTVTEAGSGVDSTAATMTFRSAVTEAGSGVDADSSLVVFGGAVTEAASGVDANSTIVTFRSSITEAGSAVDSSFGVITFPTVFIVETASGVDATSASGLFISAISETGSGLDRPTANGSFISSVAETASGVDNTVGYITFPSSITETASGIDSPSSLAVFVGTVSEAAAGLDVDGAQGVFVSTAVETASGLDQAQTAAAFGALLAEGASGVDSLLSGSAFFSTVAEASSSLDAVSSLAVFSANVQETSAGLDAFTAFAIFVSQVSESAAGVDIVDSQGSVFTATVAENAAGSALFTALYLWNLIDDNQNADWANMATSSNPLWGVVDTDQSTVWLPIQDSSDAGWGVVDDSAPTTWQNVPTIN